MFIVVGLGNPGDKYKATKHNVGFMAIDYLADKANIPLNKIKFKSLYGEGNIANQKVILAKPQTYMNLSGESVLELMNYYKVPIENLIVVYDDIDLDVGRIRIRPKGSSGTHNGMKSIIYLLQSDNFIRVRIGIGKQPSYMDLGNYVMGKFHGDETLAIEAAITNTCSAIEEIIKNGINSSMNKYNK